MRGAYKISKFYSENQQLLNDTYILPLSHLCM